jgi:glyoxylase-like metal-dependent hydrolase (beta-lactamase superfamily II)
MERPGMAEAETIGEDLRRLVAPNPSPLTFRGTNTYILGRGEVAVIDPGPASEVHLAAILGALGPAERVGAILVTHSHLDHSPLARPLSAASGAPILAAGGSDWGRRPVMQGLAETGDLGGGEGVDSGFAPDRQITDGAMIEGGWGRIEAVSTPGHMANHMAFAWRGALFAGDTVMGWATTLVSPPDGDMTAYLGTLARLAARDDQVVHPGHGPPIADPKARIAELVAHRRAREAAILARLAEAGAASPAEIATAVYRDTDPALLPAATRNVLAHLLDLLDRKLVSTEGVPHARSTFTRT